MDIKSALIIGFLHIFSLIPGVSRSGIAITAARFLKFDRVNAAKISFLLSIPTARHTLREHTAPPASRRIFRLSVLCQFFELPLEFRIGPYPESFKCSNVRVPACRDRGLQAQAGALGVRLAVQSFSPRGTTSPPSFVAAYADAEPLGIVSTKRGRLAGADGDVHRASHAENAVVMHTQHAHRACACACVCVPTS